MSLSIMLRGLTASICMVTGIYQSKLQKLANNEQSVILMYHRIVSPALTSEYVEPGMYVKPATFKMHLSILDKFFNVVSLQELTDNSHKRSKKPLCAITFDDGWLDFYTNAYPLLQNKKIPATVFIPTDFIGTNKWFWTDRLADILKKLTIPTQKNKNKQNKYLPDRIEQLTGSLFSRIDSAIKLLKPCSQEQIAEILQELETRAQISPSARQRVFLNWEECRVLKDSGLVTFGSHTANHIILTSENELVCKNELEISKKKLIDEHIVEPSFITFCYPNGNFSPGIIDLVEKAGYCCAVTTTPGHISKTCNRYTLNRVGMHQDMTANKVLALARILN
jgi:peptidoglycan/xylan/chitin deacetylase (PgdA/CDA1 family)